MRLGLECLYSVGGVETMEGRAMLTDSDNEQRTDEGRNIHSGNQPQQGRFECLNSVCTLPTEEIQPCSTGADTERTTG